MSRLTAHSQAVTKADGGQIGRLGLQKHSYCAIDAVSHRRRFGHCLTKTASCDRCCV